MNNHTAMLHRRWRLALRSRLLGGGFKPPYSELAKDCRAKRYGKVRALTLSGASQEDERKRTTAEVFEIGMDDVETGGWLTPGTT